MWSDTEDSPDLVARQISMFGPDQAEVRCCQCSCSFSLLWLQVSAKLLCLSQPLSTMHGNQDASVVQSFTLALCTCAEFIPSGSQLNFSPEFETFLKETLGIQPMFRRNLFSFWCVDSSCTPAWSLPYPQHRDVLCFPLTNTHPSLLKACRLFPSTGQHFVRESPLIKMSSGKQTTLSSSAKAGPSQTEKIEALLKHNTASWDRGCACLQGRGKEELWGWAWAFAIRYSSGPISIFCSAFNKSRKKCPRLGSKINLLPWTKGRSPCQCTDLLWPYSQSL